MRETLKGHSLVTNFMGTGNGEKGNRGLEVLKSKRLSRGPIREDPISLKHIYLFNILPSWVLVHQKV